MVQMYQLAAAENCWLQRKAANPPLRTGRRQLCMNLPLLWSHQEPVTEHCFTYNRLGPGTGQVYRTGSTDQQKFLKVQVAV